MNLNTVRRVGFSGTLFLLLLPATALVPALAQDEPEEESGEEIIARELFLNMRRAGGPGRRIPVDAYADAVRQREQLERGMDFTDRLSGTWVTANPVGMFYARTNANYISGRTNVIAFHPTNPSILYIGAAGGGVWKTTNAGTTWQVQTDFLTSIACGAVTIDPNNPEVVYFGTGELNYSLDSYYGDGIYKTTNGGTSWTKIATTAVGSRFSQIVVDPSNSNIVYAAGSGGVYKSTNAGSTWTSTASGNNANCILIDPTSTQTLYTTTGGYGANAVRKSTNGGTSWTTLTNGLPTSGTSRTQLAMAPSNANVLYASIAAAGSYGLLGLYKTTDAGASWTLQNSTTNYLGGQGWYDNSVTVHPTNPNFVVVGGIDIYTSSNSGVTLTKRTDWATTSASNMAHADIQFLGYNGTILYCGSDGGVYKSTNDGVTWSDLNQTLSTLQYQSADYDPTNILLLYGGTQDNNLETSTDGGAMWIQRTTGDGGYSIVDPVTTNYVYGQYVNGSIKRSSNRGVTFTEIRPNGSSGGLFYNPYEMAPGDPNTVLFGRADLWKTTSVRTATSASGWTQIATTTTIGGSISAIGISHTNINKYYIGTSNGKIMVTTNNGSSWTTNSGYPYVTDFAVDPGNDNVCYASFSGFNAAIHVYKTTNGGSTWFSVTGNLPNIPVNSIVLIPASPRMLFLGTDLGVYQSTNDGATWVSFNTGLPTVAVFDLKYKDTAQLLMAATHGRGCWMYDLSEILPIQLASLTATVVAPHVRLDWVTLTELNNYGFVVQRREGTGGVFADVPDSFVPGHGTTLVPQYYTFTDMTVTPGHWFYRLKQIDLDGTIHYTDAVEIDVLTTVAEQYLPESFVLEQNYPNPFNPVTTIAFSMPTEAHVTLELFNTVGQRVVTLVDGIRPAGHHNVQFDGGTFASGVYYYRMKSAEFVSTRRLTLLR